MRLVQLVVDDDQRDTAIETLRDAGADVVALDGDERDVTILLFPLPTGAIENVIGQLRDAGVETDNYRVLALEAAENPTLDDLEDEYTEGPETASRISHSELQSAAQESEPERVTFVAQVILSATVAAAGLLLDSAVIIVGSMVIAPFTNAALSLGAGAAVDDTDLMANSAKTQLFGLVLAVITGGGVGLVARWTSIVSPALAISSISQVYDFSSPNLLVLAIAGTAGGAGAFALATDQGTSIAGVAVAAAIVPAAAAAGVGLAWRNVPLAFGAATLLAMNVLLINLVAFLTLTALGYRGGSIHLDWWTDIDGRTIGYGVLVAVVVVAAVATAAITGSYVAADRAINDEVSATLSQSTDDALSLTGVRIGYTGFSPFQRNATVIVTIRKPAERRYPALTKTLKRRIRTEIDQPVTVDVQYESYR